MDLGERADAEPIPGTVFTGRQVRLLKVAVVVMGVLLVGGFAFVLSAIIYQASNIGTTSDPASTAGAPGSNLALAAGIALPLPAGTSVSHVALDGNRLAVHLAGRRGGEIVIVDLGSGKVVSRVRLQAQ